MNHTGHHQIDLIAQKSQNQHPFALIGVNLVYNRVRFSPDGPIAATMQMMVSGILLVGGAGNEVFSWSE